MVLKWQYNCLSQLFLGQYIAQQKVVIVTDSPGADMWGVDYGAYACGKILLPLQFCCMSLQIHSQHLQRKIQLFQLDLPRFWHNVKLRTVTHM